MPRHVKGPEKVIDINAGVRDLLTHAGVKSSGDLLHGPAADCCLEACECCLQISVAGQVQELNAENKKIIGPGHGVR